VRPYTLFLETPSGWKSGDVTLTDGVGRFCSFFWGAGAWETLAVEEKRIRLETWIRAAEKKLGAVLDDADLDLIRYAVLTMTARSS
jgi:hypothetical protein